MNSNEEYVKQLEETIAKFLEPLENIPFPIAIKAISGYRVIPFNNEDDVDKALLGRLIKAMKIATKTANEEGIFTARPNEVGNHIEPFVKDALLKVGVKEVDIPQTVKGTRQAAGYPDLFIRDVDDRVTYLECKTYNRKSIGSSFRAFYFSPPSRENSKITTDARHLVATFEIEIAERNNKRAYVPVRWKLYSLDTMLVQVKHEFNASNKQMYRPEALLAEGTF